MNLCIDIGNTCTKYGIFSGNHLMKSAVRGYMPLVRWKSVLKNNKGIKNIVLSSVVKHSPGMGNFFSSHANFILLSPSTPLPLKIHYRRPRTLGPDRIAAAVGAKALFPEKPVLAIMAGSCITYNFITLAGQFTGGGISPGLAMRFAALHLFTGKLPLVKYRGNNAPIIGKSTEESIISGVINGVVSEICGTIVKYRRKYPFLKVVISGGDGSLLCKMVRKEIRIKNTIFAAPFLVLKGMNIIADYRSNLFERSTPAPTYAGN